MCDDAYALSDHTACARTQRCSQKKMVSLVQGKTYVTWRYHCRVLSTSQGVQLNMQGTAECNARKTEAREYPEKHAICAQDVML